MEVDEEDTTRTPKKLKTIKPRNLVQVAKAKGKSKTMKVKGPTFEVQEYTFDSVPEGTMNKYKSKTELLDSYKDVGENTFDEKL